MYKNFNKLPEDRKSKIIDVCIEEFAIKGYDKASTNAIVNKAAISKGSLFHYFGSKKNLYLFIFNYALDYLYKKWHNMKIDLSEDIFERIAQLGIIKIKISSEEPLIFRLVFTAIINTPEEVKEEIYSRYNRLYKENIKYFFKDVDMSKFKKDIDRKKAVECINFVMEGLYNKYINEYSNYPSDKLIKEKDNLIDEYMKYMDILKKGIYEE